MSMKSVTSLPKRLCAGEATELERRLLRAASEEQPPREIAERMARAIGVAPPASSNPGGDSAPNLGSPAPEVAAAGGGTLLPWFTGTVAVAVVVAGAFVLGHSEPSAPSAQRRVTAPPVSANITPIASSSPSSTTGMALVDAPPHVVSTQDSAAGRPVPSTQRRKQTRRAVDLEEQIALIDAARAAVAGALPERALTTLDQYQKRYASGSFGPEATALRVEALVKLGRNAEARAHATRFVARHPGSPLADRVARLAGLL